MTDATVVQKTDPTQTIHGAGDVYRYLATGAQTNGTYFAMHAVVPPGGGPPPHIQTREDEGFYLIEGTVRFWVAGEVVDAEPGTFLNVPRGVLHNFRNESDSDATMLIWFAPAGIEGMFAEMHKNPDGYAEIASSYGVEFPG